MSARSSSDGSSKSESCPCAANTEARAVELLPGWLALIVAAPLLTPVAARDCAATDAWVTEPTDQSAVSLSGATRESDKPEAKTESVAAAASELPDEVVDDATAAVDAAAGATTA